jgi:hypothetical protein
MARGPPESRPASASSKAISILRRSSDHTQKTQTTRQRNVARLATWHRWGQYLPPAFTLKRGIATPAVVGIAVESPSPSGCSAGCGGVLVTGPAITGDSYALHVQHTALTFRTGGCGPAPSRTPRAASPPASCRTPPPRWSCPAAGAYAAADFPQRASQHSYARPSQAQPNCRTFAMVDSSMGRGRRAGCRLHGFRTPMSAVGKGVRITSHAGRQHSGADRARHVMKVQDDKVAPAVADTSGDWRTPRKRDADAGCPQIRRRCPRLPFALRLRSDARRVLRARAR